MEATLMKYTGPDGDYLVLDTAMNHLRLDSHAVRVICSRNFGVGARGMLVGSTSGSSEDMSWFNTDGDLMPMDESARRVARSWARGRKDAGAEWMDARVHGDQPYLTGKILLTDRFIRNNHLASA